MSLRLRVIAAAVLVVVAPVIVIALAGLRERNLAAEMRVDVGAAARELAAADAASPDRARELATAHGVWLRVVAPDGEVVVSEDFDRSEDTLHRIGQLFFGPDGAPTLAEHDGTLGPIAARDELAAPDDRGLATSCHTAPGGKLLVCYAAQRRPDGSVVVAAQSSRRAVRALYDLRYQVLRLTVGLLPFAVLLAALLGRHIVRPIRTLSSQARERAAEPRAGARLSEVGDEEVRELAVAFNELLARLEERQKNNQAFTADLVHELKSPLATVRAAADALAAGPVEGARAERLARALRDAGGRLDGIVSQFLELARAEAGLVGDERSDLRVGELARRVAEACGAAHPDVELALACDETLVVRGVAHSLDVALRNLIENALSFAAAQSERPPRVEVVVRPCPKSREGEPFVEIRVTDNGPGIAPEALPRVFERFFTSREDRRGTGLGLALVKASLEAHGGAVEVESGSEAGTTFRARLPAAAISA